MATAAGVLSLREAARPARSFDWRRTAVEFLLVAVPLIVAGAFLPAPVSLLAAMVLVVPLVWKAPVRGVYFLVAAAVIVEIFPLRYPDSLTDRIPLFENLSNVGISGISASPVEVLMIEIGLLSMARARSQEGIALRPRGPLVKAYIFFAAVLLAAEVHGLFSGGDIKLSLWELRPQGYGFVMFMLAGTLVRTRRQVITLGVVTMLATALKAVLGAWRWQFTLNHSLGSRETLLAHEDSYFMGLFVVAVVVGLVYWRRRSTL
ncbi:MAG: hypothetical protein J2P45_31115, partial [Candidatus Dormibacteraeota bacterium]|nr:hypothetical protein [Candidatus Dormibacteraeota bacterium]